MINIPTELLRTLIAVIDLRSFTRAAQHLGVTQPAVSAQLKRLQVLLGGDILDKSAPGVSLTPLGDLVCNHARRMLSINDQIVNLSGPRSEAHTIRIGVPGDFAAPILPRALVSFRAKWPDVRFRVRSHNVEQMLQELRDGQLDIVVGLRDSQVAFEARHYWSEEMVWIRAPSLRLDPTAPIPVVTFGDHTISYRLMAAALNDAGLSHDRVFASPSAVSLYAAVAAGLGVSALPRSRLHWYGLQPWEDAPLPKVRDLPCAIYIRDDCGAAPIEELADVLADILHPRGGRQAMELDGISLALPVS